MNKKLIAITLIAVFIIAAAVLLLNQDPKSNSDTNNTINTEITEDSIDNNKETFICYVDGEKMDYSTNISIDTPIPTETRVSGIAEDGSNIKLILRTQTAGDYISGSDFGMSYQNFSEGFDYNKIYSPTSASSITLSLQEFSDTRITAEFAGDIYDGNNNKMVLSDCLVNVSR